MRHKLLERQLRQLSRRHKNPEALLEAFSDIVSRTYEEADKERRKKDRSLELMSDELMEVNRRILQRNKALISGILENVVDGIVTTNEKFEIRSFNQAAEKIFSLRESEVIGKKLDILFADDCNPYIRELFRKNDTGELSTGKEKDDFIGKRANGQLFPLEFTLSVIPLEDEKIIFTRFRDITSRKDFEYQIIKAKETAEAAAKSKSIFLSNMSHEIRTPMNAVLGLTTFLLENNPRKDQEEILELIRFSGDNLLVIINDILDFSKIEANKIELESIDFDIRKVISSIQASLLPNAEEKKIFFKVEIDERIPDLMKGDSVRLSQIITNLVSNAIKFTLRGGVTLNAQLTKNCNDHHHIHISVSDTGIGIPPEKQKLVFESFSQSNSSTTREFGGTGLGLAITRRLLGLMGSEIHLQSTTVEGESGSVFSFDLKLPKSNKQPIQKTRSQDISSSFSGLEGIRVLLAEDNRVNRIVAGKYLKKWKIAYEIAESGIEVLEKIKDKNIDLILMDLQMPKMDGFEASRQIRANPDPYFREIPIIALSASAVGEIFAEIKEAGMTDYVSKPFQPKVLYQTIQRWSAKENVKQ